MVFNGIAWRRRGEVPGFVGYVGRLGMGQRGFDRVLNKNGGLKFLGFDSG